MKRTTLKSTLALAAILALPGLASAQARTFQVQSGSAIRFVSDATLETTVGTSRTVTGELTVDPQNLRSASGRVSVPVRSLRTGIDLRDEHLRSDNWLDAARNPNAVFEITGVTGATSLQPGQQTNVTIQGNFSIHGVTHPVTARARVVWDGASSLRGRAQFSIDLEDYDVSVPSIVRLKVSNTIAITVSIRATAAS